MEKPAPSQPAEEDLLSRIVAEWKGPNGDYRPFRQELAEGMLSAALREGNPEAVRGYVRGMLQVGLDARGAYERLTRNKPRWPPYHGILAEIQQDQARERDHARWEAQERERQSG